MKSNNEIIIYSIVIIKNKTITEIFVLYFSFLLELEQNFFYSDVWLEFNDNAQTYFSNRVAALL